jgi:hypothetical protein
MRRILDSIKGGFSKLFLEENRRTLTGHPTSVTPEFEDAWKRRTVKTYAVNQPYASPLTAYHGSARLTGETREMRAEYREWAFREPTTKAAVMTKCLATSSLDPQLIANDPNDRMDKEAAQWVDWALTRAVGGVGGLIQSMTLPALIDGFSVLEKCYNTIDESGGKYKDFWSIEKYAMCDTEQLRFKLDPYRQIIGIRPMTGLLAGWEELNPGDFVMFTHLKMFEDPFGISDLRAVVRDCRLLEDAIQLRHMLMSNFSGPFIAAAHSDPTVREQLLGIIATARGAGYIVVPNGTEIDVLNLATATPDIFERTISSLRESIVSAIDGGYLQLLEGGTSDGRGNTMVHKSVAELYVWWLAMWVCEVVNRQIIPDLVIPNYGNSVGLPRLQLGGIDENAISAALGRFKAGQELGVTLSMEQVRSVGGFEVPRNPTDVLSPPSAAPGQDPKNPVIPLPGGSTAGSPAAAAMSQIGGGAASVATFRG